MLDFETGLIDTIKERPQSYALPRRQPQCAYVGCAGRQCPKDAVKDTPYCTTHNDERPSETSDRNYKQTAEQFAGPEHPLYGLWKEGVFDR